VKKVRIIFADGFDKDDNPPVWEYRFHGLKHGEEVSIYIGKDGKIHGVNSWGILNNAKIRIEQDENEKEV